MKNIFAVSLFALWTAMSACGGVANSNAVNEPVNATASPTIDSNTGTAPLATPKTTATSAGSLATPTDAYKMAFALREKKDIAGLKKIMADDVKEFLTEIGEAEKKSLDDMIKEMFLKPQAKTDESRNEKIDGNHATLEYPSETGDWKTMDFQKVEGRWLLSLPKRDKDVK